MPLYHLINYRFDICHCGKISHAIPLCQFTFEDVITICSKHPLMYNIVKVKDNMVLVHNPSGYDFIRRSYEKLSLYDIVGPTVLELKKNLEQLEKDVQDIKNTLLYAPPYLQPSPGYLYSKFSFEKHQTLRNSI